MLLTLRRILSVMSVAYPGGPCAASDGGSAASGQRANLLPNGCRVFPCMAVANSALEMTPSPLTSSMLNAALASINDPLALLRGVPRRLGVGVTSNTKGMPVLPEACTDDGPATDGPTLGGGPGEEERRAPDAGLLAWGTSNMADSPTNGNRAWGSTPASVALRGVMCLEPPRLGVTAPGLGVTAPGLGPAPSVEPSGARGCLGVQRLLGLWPWIGGAWPGSVPRDTSAASKPTSRGVRRGVKPDGPGDGARLC